MFNEAVASSSEDEWSYVNTAQAKDRRTKNARWAWKRLMFRYLFAMKTANHELVITTSQLQVQDPATPDEKEMPSTPASSKGSKERKQRRDDLCYVGQALAPSIKTYPVSRDTCAHPKDFVLARGGRRGILRGTPLITTGFARLAARGGKGFPRKSTRSS